MPCLLVSDGRLIKTRRFSKPAYVGDPLNAIKIFNEKEVDELVLLDIRATRDGRPPALELIREVARECFMPLCYGGGVRTLEHIEQLILAGVEKIALNTIAIERPSFVREAAKAFGSQAIVVSIDVKRSWVGRAAVFSHGGERATSMDAVGAARMAQESGAGELLLTSIDREGSWAGFDLPLIRSVTEAVEVPVIASGGAGSIEDIGQAVLAAGASAVALGSMAVYQAKDLGVLINFPSRAALDAIFGGHEAPIRMS